MPALVPTLRSMLESFAVRVATEIKQLGYLAKPNLWTADQTFATGRVALTGSSTNIVEFDPAGLGTPTLGAAPSAGQKVTLCRTRSTNDSDYAIGVGTNELWCGVGSASTNRAFGWYWGATRRMRLDSSGNLSAGGTISAANLISAGSFQNSSAVRTAAVSLTSNNAASNLCDASGGAFAVSMYSSATTPGQRFTIVKTDASANAVTLNVTGGGTFVGPGVSVASITLASQWDSIEVESTATAGQWLIINRERRDGTFGALSAASIALTGSETIGGLLTVAGGSKLGGATVSAGNLTINGNTNKYVEFSTAGSVCTLPSVSSFAGFDFYIINASTGTITVQGAAAAATIGNTASATQTYSLPAGATLHVVSTGSAWRIL